MVDKNVLGLDVLEAKPQFGVVGVGGEEITVEENQSSIRDTGVLIDGFREVSISGNRVSTDLDLTEQAENPTVGMDILRCGEALIGDDEDIEAGANVVVRLMYGIHLRLDDRPRHRRKPCERLWVLDGNVAQ
jgi:hypothetical protein